MKPSRRVNLHTAAGLLALSDAQYDRHLHLRDLRGIWPEGNPQAQTGREWDAQAADQRQNNSNADDAALYR